MQKPLNIERECPKKGMTEDAGRNTDGPSNMDSAAILDKVKTEEADNDLTDDNQKRGEHIYIDEPI